jgi:hypothetical protein
MLQARVQSCAELNHALHLTRTVADALAATEHVLQPNQLEQ